MIQKLYHRRGPRVPDRVTQIRQWGEQQDVAKDAIECAIHFKRKHPSALTDQQVKELALDINARLWKWLDLGVRLGADLIEETL